MRCLSTLTLCVAVLFLFSGCEQGKPNASTDTAKAGASTAHDDDHGHDHSSDDKDGDVHHDGDDHDHDAHDAAGKGNPDVHSKVHNGHPISFGDAGFAAEWKYYGENDIIDIYVLNAEGTADMPIKAASVTVRQATGENPESFELAAVEPNAEGETAHFQRDDQRLATAIALGVVVEIEFKGEKKTATIAPYTPHKH